jgi:ABC-2 type transport system permease protein
VSLVTILDKYNTGGEEVNGDIALTMLAMSIVQVLFLVLGSALAAIKRKARNAASAATGILLLTYILSIAIDLNKSIEILKYVTPFKYFEAKNIMFGGGFELSFVIISVVIIAGLTMVTYVFYQKRDLNV